MIFLAQTAIAVVNLVAGFYGFWLVWRVLLPILPGPPDADQRLAPYAHYFTDPSSRRWRASSMFPTGSSPVWG